ncbi:MAG: replication factor C large subunit [Candidatus Pacearchaeota archaeon]
MNKIISWVEKYRPRYLSEIRGQKEVVYRIREFIKVECLKKFNIRDKERKVIIFYGPSGTGKTTMGHVIAREVGAELFELNASDLRNSEKLRQILKPATEQASLTKKSKVILIDEIDGISEEDESGIPIILSIIETTYYPMIITANDIWNKKFLELRKKSELIQFKEIDPKIIREVLIEILEKEKKFLQEDIINDIAIKSKGDLRAAINDLQAVVNLKDSQKIILIDERNKELDIFNALKILFKEKPNNTMLNLFDSVKKPMDEIILWIEENIPTEYKGVELAKAYDILSKVDIFGKRIIRQQYWRLLIYQNALLSYGISSSKKDEKIAFVRYRKPTRILKMWMNNNKIDKKKAIAKKYAKHVHIGEKRALREFSTIKQFLLNPKIQEELRLSEEEIEYLNDDISSQ